MFPIACRVQSVNQMVSAHPKPGSETTETSYSGIPSTGHDSDGRTSQTRGFCQERQCLGL